MAKFTYQAIDEVGKTVSGVIEADSPTAVNSMLADRGFIPSRITRRGDVSGPSAWDSVKGVLTKVKAADLIANHIEAKRDALGINVKAERKLYDMEDRRALEVK